MKYHAKPAIKRTLGRQGGLLLHEEKNIKRNVKNKLQPDSQGEKRKDKTGEFEICYLGPLQTCKPHNGLGKLNNNHIRKP